MQYENLDEEHKGLFKGVFAVAEKPGDGGALSHLVDIVKKHFATEEVSILAVAEQGRSQKFVSEGDKTGVLGQKFPSGVQGQRPGGGLEAKPPEAEDIYANNHCNNVTKTPYFFSMGISAGICPPLPYAPVAEHFFIRQTAEGGFDGLGGSGRVHQRLSTPTHPLCEKFSTDFYTFRVDPSGQLRGDPDP